MTGDELGVAAQRVRDGQVAAAVAEVVERIAANLDRIAESTRQSAVCTPPEFAAEVFGHRKRAEAFERAAEVVRSYVPPRAVELSNLARGVPTDQ